MIGLRLKITLLVMGAIIAMSLIGIAASFSVLMIESNGERIVFRYQNAPTTYEALPHPGGILANPDIMPSYAVAIMFALFIVVGASVVSVIVANMVVRPLLILQNAVDSVNPHDFIPPINEAKPQSDLGATKLLNTLSNKLRSTLENRMRLVAAAGHDLRTPITRMRLRAEFIEDAEERAQWEKDIDEMTHIAESTINLVKEEIGPDSQESVDIEMMLYDLTSELSELDHDIKLTTSSPAMVKGGFHSLKRALSNLIINAAIHGGSAKVSLATEGDFAIIRISDNGPGIPDVALHMAFEPFFRANSGREKKADGAGLGLSIAKELIDRHGGQITLFNKPSGGLLQTVKLPLDLNSSAPLSLS
ncbi:ATP-binding protein [Mesorhizobium sp. SP-1A]|uniref:ATP-binding protein n=1 Tax=Mesorhizobium sp. SP-1A TaxID=3077840 RepID=UPI0028F70C68|nr:ATP-binding protein [Mesorhizobium sp. SP-1A]